MLKNLQTISLVLSMLFFGQVSFAQGGDCASATIAVAGTNTADGPADGGGASNICDIDGTNADWYTYTPDANYAVTLSSCLQGVDTRVSVMEGSCGALTCIANNDDACELTPGGSTFASLVTFNALQGNTYYIEWDDRWSAEGFDWTLDEEPIITEAPDCPTLSTPADGAVDVSINEGTNNSVTLTWMLPGTGAQISNVSIYFGLDPDNLFNLGAIGVVETINIINAAYSTTYYWQIVTTNAFGDAVDCPIFSFTTEGDIFECPGLGLNIGDACNDGDVNTFGDTVTEACECVGTLFPTNIDCENAIVLEQGITMAAVIPTEGTSVSNLCLTSAFNSIWYSYTPSGSGQCTVSSSIDLDQPDTRVSIFTGSCDELTCYASDDDGGEGFTSLISFDVVQDETYYIEWDDRWGNDEFDFELSCDLIVNGDPDEDLVFDPDDNCPVTFNPDQADLDEDGLGDACDDDIDGDGVVNSDDCDPMDAALFIGATCDDGNPETIGDMIDTNCNCVGEIPPTSNVRFTVVNVPMNQITFKNFGNAQQDISEWRLCSNFNYSENLSGETIVSGDLILSPNEEVTVQWNPATGFRETGDDIGVYLPSGSFTNPNAMVDFMQYLSAGNGRESVAVEKGIWGTGDFVDGESPFSFIGTGSDTGVSFWAGFVEFDFDEDGISDLVDNCIETPNPDQADMDSDGQGDVCDSDIDGDGVVNSSDCDPMDILVFPGSTCDDGDPTTVMDVLQEDCTCMGLPNDDADSDGVIDILDNCVDDSNADQADLDEDGLGDVCDSDIDGDGETNDVDCDPMDADVFLGASCDDGNADTINDEIQEDCTCMGIEDGDADTDGVMDSVDNCVDIPNADQADLDEDGMGDVCDDDIDGDGEGNDVDCDPMDADVFLGASCDDGNDNTINDEIQDDCSCTGMDVTDSDTDGVFDSVDNCVDIPNADQADLDEDGMGDVCDEDIDGDGENNDVDCDPEDAGIFLGASCDDGDPNTGNDVIQDDCSCAGEPDVNQAPNANCADATAISEGLITGADIFGGQGASLNCFGDGAVNSLWYLYTASQNGFATVSSGVDPNLSDTRLSVYIGSCDNLTCLTSNDDLSGTNFTSMAIFEVSSGESFLIEWDDRWNDDAFDFEISVGEAPVDSDMDGVIDITDNCVDDANPGQEDLDGDGDGDACDEDIDGDGDLNEVDCEPNNPLVFLGASCNDGDPNTSGDVIVEDCSCQGVVGIEDVDSVNGGIVLYPNPVSDQLFVKFGLTESNQISFDIYDVAGRLVSSEVTSLVIEENLYSIDTKDMNQGLYFLKVSSDEDETTKRFSVVR